MSYYPSDFYHITLTTNVKSILRNGLLPGRRSRFDGSTVEPDKSCVYLSDSPNHCPRLAGLGSDDTTYGYSILCIDADKLDIHLYRPDEDYLRDALKLTQTQARQAVEANADLWDDSLGRFQSLAYRGIVPPDAIWDVLKVGA